MDMAYHRTGHSFGACIYLVHNGSCFQMRIFLHSVETESLFISNRSTYKIELGLIGKLTLVSDNSHMRASVK